MVKSDMTVSMKIERQAKNHNNGRIGTFWEITVTGSVGKSEPGEAARFLEMFTRQVRAVEPDMGDEERINA
jgi:hypothetical protein